MKNCCKGKAAVWDKHVIKENAIGFNGPQQRLIFEISLFTGERMGEDLPS